MTTPPPAAYPLAEPSGRDPRELPGFRRAFAEGRLTLGLGLPLESYRGDMPEMDLAEQSRLVRRCDESELAALYVRDIPLRVETFGDNGQVFDPWTYLGFLAAQTSRIALGTGAIVLPVRHPLHVAKAAASLDRLSGGRLLLGIASGDRPAEFSAFGVEQGERGEVFREHLDVLVHAMSTSYRGKRWSGGWMHSAEVVPKPLASTVPLLITGSSQQSMKFNAAHGHGWMTYPRAPSVQRNMVREWRRVVTEQCGDEYKPFTQSLGLDLHDDPEAAPANMHMGVRLGRNRLIEHLRELQGFGIDHVMFGLKGARRPAGEIVEELLEYVVPEFPAHLGDNVDSIPEDPAPNRQL